MRLKRLMSLVLAMALALSLVTVASAANDVLFHEDYSGYVDTAEKTGVQAYFEAQIQNFDTTNVLAFMSNTPGKFYANKGWLNHANSLFVTNQAGKKAFEPHANSGSPNVTMAYPLAEGWDLAAAENANKTLVFVYDFEYASTGTASRTKTENANLIFANADSSVKANLPIFGITAGPNRTFQFRHAYNGSAKAARHDMATTPDTTYRIAIGIAPNNIEDSYFTRTYAMNGVGLADDDNPSNVVTGNHQNFTGVETKVIGFAIGSPSSDTNANFADIMLYTIDTNSFAVSASKTTNLNENETITFNFTNPVSKAAFEANKAGITVKEGDDEFTGFEVGDLVTTVANGQINSSVTIRFEGLKDSETYTVEFPAGITNEIGQSLNNREVVLATVVPDLKVGSFTVISGWGDDAEEAASFTAEATLQGGKLEVVNNKEEDLDVAVIYAVYGHNGQLADMVYVQDVLKANGTSEIQAGVTLSENLTEGASTGKVKAFIWNTIDALKPYLGATERNIVAAQ